MPSRYLSSVARLVVAVSLAVATSACDVVVGGLHARETAKDTWQRSFQLADGGRFELVNQNGRIEVEAVDGDTIEVVAERSAGAPTIDEAKDLLKQVEIQAEVTAGLVKITTKAPKSFGRQHANVKYQVKVPRLTVVWLTNTNGVVKVNGVKGAVHAESTNGTVAAVGIGGEVEARTTNGSVEVEIDQVTGEGVRLETTNGSIELRLPRTVKADLRASAVNGGVHTTDLEVESSREGTRRRIEGRLNGGGAPIEATTVNGGIRLVGK